MCVYVFDEMITMHGMCTQVDEEVRLEQERRVLEGKKHLIHEQLVQSVSPSAGLSQIVSAGEGHQ